MKVDMHRWMADPGQPPASQDPPDKGVEPFLTSSAAVDIVAPWPTYINAVGGTLVRLAQDTRW